MVKEENFLNNPLFLVVLHTIRKMFKFGFYSKSDKLKKLI